MLPLIALVLFLVIAMPVGNAAREKFKSSLTVLAWNVYIGRTASEVRRDLHPILKAHRPEVVGLMEATRLFGHLNGMGYQVVQLKPRAKRPGNRPGDANVAIMVRNDCEIVQSFAMRMRTFWRGPKHGLGQDPRVYRWVLVRLPNQKRIYKIGVAHTPFGEAARAESRNRLVRWFRRTVKGRSTVLVLDANMSRGEFTKTIAKPAGANEVDGKGIDLAAGKNVKLVKKENLGRNDSDHPAMLYSFVPD